MKKYISKVGERENDRIAQYWPPPWRLGSRGKKTVSTKVVDDRLKIIDEVPSSAVEMSVKEKVSSSIMYQSCGFDYQW